MKNLDEANIVPVTREDLYEQVWSTPLRNLAQRYGLSDVGLAKVCNRMTVPVPGRGYWAKKAAGKPVKQVPLPPVPSNAMNVQREVQLGPRPTAGERWLRDDGEPLSATILHRSEPSAHSAVTRFFSGAPAPLESATLMGSSRDSSSTAAEKGCHRPVAAEELRLRVSADLSNRLQLAHLARIGATREETAISLIERGFEAEKARIKEFLHAI